MSSIFSIRDLPLFDLMIIYYKVLLVLQGTRTFDFWWNKIYVQNPQILIPISAWAPCIISLILCNTENVVIEWILKFCVVNTWSGIHCKSVTRFNIGLLVSCVQVPIGIYDNKIYVINDLWTICAFHCTQIYVHKTEWHYKLSGFVWC